MNDELKKCNIITCFYNALVDFYFFLRLIPTVHSIFQICLTLVQECMWLAEYTHFCSQFANNFVTFELVLCGNMINDKIIEI